LKSTAILIPARYESSRFPGKPLCNLGGTTMIRRVYDACVKTGFDTYVLTDHRSVAHAIPLKHVIYDNREFSNGTERCAGAALEKLDYDQYINVQGDMPDVTPEIINDVHWHLKNYEVTTVWTPMPKDKQDDPHSVKMIRAGDQALWFGRGITGYGDWHLGVYGYKRNMLELYPRLPIEKEEEIEKLEQLRWLKNGVQIGVTSVEWNGIEINTPEDARKWHESR